MGECSNQQAYRQSATREEMMRRLGDVSGVGQVVIWVAMLAVSLLHLRQKVI